mmetsp:Transcript_6975/g.12514  ORF Transcript_6975/g.12514 Transcript_6975/m.12514 type:complete len:298 (-) Transcript_6975:256-1149(-)
MPCIYIYFHPCHWSRFPFPHSLPFSPFFPPFLLLLHIHISPLHQEPDRAGPLGRHGLIRIPLVPRLLQHLANPIVIPGIPRHVAAPPWRAALVGSERDGGGKRVQHDLDDVVGGADGTGDVDGKPSSAVVRSSGSRAGGHEHVDYLFLGAVGARVVQGDPPQNVVRRHSQRIRSDQVLHHLLVHLIASVPARDVDGKATVRGLAFGEALWKGLHQGLDDVDGRSHRDGLVDGQDVGIFDALEETRPAAPAPHFARVALGLLYHEVPLLLLYQLVDPGGPRHLLQLVLRVLPERFQHP